MQIYDVSKRIQYDTALTQERINDIQPQTLRKAHGWMRSATNVNTREGGEKEAKNLCEDLKGVNTNERRQT